MASKTEVTKTFAQTLARNNQRFIDLIKLAKKNKVATTEELKVLLESNTADSKIILEMFKSKGKRAPSVRKSETVNSGLTGPYVFNKAIRDCIVNAKNIGSIRPFDYEFNYGLENGKKVGQFSHDNQSFGERCTTPGGEVLYGRNCFGKGRPLTKGTSLNEVMKTLKTQSVSTFGQLTAALTCYLISNGLKEGRYFKVDSYLNTALGASLDHLEKTCKGFDRTKFNNNLLMKIVGFYRKRNIDDKNEDLVAMEAKKIGMTTASFRANNIMTPAERKMLYEDGIKTVRTDIFNSLREESEILKNAVNIYAAHGKIVKPLKEKKVPVAVPKVKPGTVTSIPEVKAEVKAEVKPETPAAKAVKVPKAAPVPKQPLDLPAKKVAVKKQ